MENLNTTPVNPDEKPEQEINTEAETIKQQELGSKAMGAASVAQSEITDKSGAQKTERYVDSHGVVHTSLEDLRDAEEGYK